MTGPRGIHDVRRDPRDDGYNVEMACGNCEWSGSVTISKGVPVPKRGFSSSRCPNCHCLALVKTLDQKPRL